MPVSLRACLAEGALVARPSAWQARVFFSPRSNHAEGGPSVSVAPTEAEASAYASVFRDRHGPQRGPHLSQTLSHPAWRSRRPERSAFARGSWLTVALSRGPAGRWGRRARSSVPGNSADHSRVRVGLRLVKTSKHQRSSITPTLPGGSGRSWSPSSPARARRSRIASKSGSSSFPSFPSRGPRRGFDCSRPPGSPCWS